MGSNVHNKVGYYFEKQLVAIQELHVLPDIDP